MKEYISGRGNLACTIFVPYDCKNNCEFCTSKALYKTYDLNLDGILEKIQWANECDAITEFVITGGEPFSNLCVLMRIINACHKKIFVNTTLPSTINERGVLELINFNPKIQGMNISRHMGFDFQDVKGEDFLSEIQKPIRINSVITTIEQMDAFIPKWALVPNVTINLRADYRKINKQTLKERDDVDDYLLAHYIYKGNTSCMVCNSEYFGNDMFTLCYHRGLEKSSFTCGEHVYVNDIIIYPDGSVHKDWDPTDNDSDFEYALIRNLIR